MSPRTSLAARDLKSAAAALRRAPEWSAAAVFARQPVHTVYGGAHLFSAGTARKLGDRALEALESHAGGASIFSEALGIEKSRGGVVYDRVVAKLRTEPVEDFRIDFEDGYGPRSDSEEDGHAAAAARAVAEGMARNTLPPFLGIRIKPLARGTVKRGLRTLDIFLSELRGQASGLPPRLVVTLPKVAGPESVKVLAGALESLERRLRFPRGAVGVELMMEAPQALGSAKALAQAARGRCVGMHLGPYDFASACGLAAPVSRLDHPLLSYARQTLQVAMAGSGVALSDGPVTLMPVGTDSAAVHRAWRLHFEAARRALDAGYYQGWDLHPAQLPSRYAAVYSFFLESLEPVSARLARFLDGAAQAVLTGSVFDDAATGQGLLAFLQRGLACGAITEAEAARGGLSPAELRLGSFLEIVRARGSGTPA